MKICIVGCGNHSAMVHGPSLRYLAKTEPDVCLAACCDLDGAKAEAYREQFGFARCYTDIRAMVEAEQPDGVLVVVPEPYVCDSAIQVMELGCPVELEKPPGLCPEETKRLIQVAQRTGLINQVAFNRRHIPLVQKLREAMQTIGDIQNLSYDFTRVARREATFETTAIHGIDAAKSIVGCDYRSVRFSYQELGEGVCNIFMDCVFENGVTAQLRFLPCAGTVTDRITVVADGHTLYLETPIWNGYDTPGCLVHAENGKLRSVISGEEQEMFLTNGFYDETRCFLECLRNGTPSRDDIASTLQSVELAECIKLRKERYDAPQASLCVRGGGTAKPSRL